MDWETRGYIDGEIAAVQSLARHAADDVRYELEGEISRLRSELAALRREINDDLANLRQRATDLETAAGDDQ